MKTEQYIEKLIAEGKLDREELNAMIAEGQALNPVPSLQRENASLLMTSLRQEAQIEQIQEEQGALFMELILQGVI